MTSAPLAAQGYHVAKRIPIGGTGRWDFVTVDTATHRLFIARENRVMVVDEVTGKEVGAITGLRGAQHVAVAQKAGHGFITSGDDGIVVMFNLASLKVLARTTADPDADVIVYDAVSDHVFSFNGEAKSIVAFDAHTGARLARVALNGSPEYGVADGAGHIYFNNASRGEVAELDTRAMKVARHWSIAPCRDASGLALDVAHHRAFSVCANHIMVVSDVTAGKRLTTLPIGARPDGVVFDASVGNALSANGDGSITVVHEVTPNRFRVVQNLATMAGARTIVLDPVTHRAFTVAAAKGKAFTLLVIER